MLPIAYWRSGDEIWLSSLFAYWRSGDEILLSSLFSLI